MTVVNTLPTSAHMIPAVTPPMSAARDSTRVFGTKAYIKVNAIATMAYGTRLARRR